MRKTKIVCTMGPNTDNKDIMEALVKNGMNVARFNFSHGDYEEQRNRMDLLKRVREEQGKPVAILLDTKGPEIRTGVLENGKKVTLSEGADFIYKRDSGKCFRLFYYLCGAYRRCKTGKPNFN